MNKLKIQHIMFQCWWITHLLFYWAPCIRLSQEVIGRSSCQKVKNGRRGLKSLELCWTSFANSASHSEKKMTDHKNKEISEIKMLNIKYVYKYTIFSLPITMPIYVYVCIYTILLPWLFQFVSSNSLLVHHRLFDADEVSKRKTIFFIQHLTFSQ